MNYETLLFIIAVLLTHLTFDFFLQSHWMASNKSKSDLALGAHVGTYTIGLILLTVALGYGKLLVGPAPFFFLVFNSGAHWLTDYVTSRMSSRLFAKQEWHNFFLVVGTDQFCHYATLFGSFAVFSQA